MTETVLVEADPGARPRARGRPIGAALSAAWLVLLIAAALLAPYLPFVDDPHAPSLNVSESPSWDHWFGTDQLGRDVFARVTWGARLSLWIAVVAVAFGMLFGATLGIVGGYRRGWIDHVLTAVVNIMLSLPALVLALFIVTVRGRSVANVTLALTILAIPVIARIVRAQTLTWADREFVKAAVILGASRTRVVLRELLPNLAPTMVSFALLTVSIVIVAEGALSFIGVGVPAPDITWGRILEDGSRQLDDAPHITISTATVLFLTVMALNFLGETVVSRSDTRTARL